MANFKGVKADYLQTFCEVSKYQSLSEAATALGISQPAVSRQLASLQKHLGYDLYQRGSHGVQLTQKGLELAPYACAVARTLVQAKVFIAGDDKNKALNLTIGLSHHLITRYTGPILQAAKRYNQDVGPLEINLVEGYTRPLIGQLERHELDAALVLGEEADLPPEFPKRRLSEDAICLLTLPDDPLAVHAYEPLSVVEGETLILPSSVSTLFEKVQSGFSTMPIRPGRLIKVSGPAAVRTAVLAGLGVGVTLRSFVEPEVRAGWLRSVGIENNGFVVGVWCLAQTSVQQSKVTERALQAVLGFTRSD